VTRAPRRAREENEDASKKIVDTILPTTMVGSYPRPHWFHDQLNGRDLRVAFKTVNTRRPTSTRPRPRSAIRRRRASTS